MNSSILEMIGDLLDAPIKPTMPILPNPSNCTDAISNAKIANTKISRRQTHSAGWSLANHIHQRLGHLIVNPSNPHDTAALVSSYTFNNDHGLSPTYSNWSPENVDRFVRNLVASARDQHRIRVEERTLSTTQKISTHTAFLVTGKRGVGKTFFLNYILSRFDEHFDAENTPILWVRLNLVEELYNSGSPEFSVGNLLNWIYGQTAKVILRYYDRHSEYLRADKSIWFKIDPIDALTEFATDLSDVPEHLQATFAETVVIKLKRIRQSFFQLGKDEPLSEQLIPAGFGKFLFDYAQECGYAIVIVFDGLDVLESTLHANQRFNRVFNAIKTLTRTDDIFGVTYIVVMRTTTLERAGDPFSTTVPTSSEICVVDLEEILDRRCTLIENEVPTLAASAYEHWYADPLYNYWPAHLTEFRAFLKGVEGYSIPVRARGLEFLLEGFEDNRRAQMQIIQFSYMDFLEKRHQQAYKLLETVLRNGCNYPPRHYRYTIESGDKLVRKVADDLDVDTRFLPSIFVFPYTTGPDGKSHLPKQEYPLLGLRLLQIVQAYSRLKDEFGEGIGPLRVAQIGHMLKTLFDYPERLVVALLEEYAEYQVIKTHGRFSISAASSTNEDVTPMPKLEFLLGGVLFDIAYLNLAAMRTPLAAEAFESRSGVSFVSPAKFDDGATAGLERWVSTKITNSISMYRLTCDINSKQEKNFSERIDLFKEARGYQTIAMKAKDLGMFSFVKTMRAEILQDISHALRGEKIGVGGRLDFDVEYVQDKIDIYRREWG